MKVHVLYPLVLLFTLQRVAGSPQVVVFDEGSEDELFAWEKNPQYASESPWPGKASSTSLYSMAPSLNYPVGMVSKETSMPGSSETTLFEITELPDGNQLEPASGNLVETETVYVTLSPNESNNVEESPAGPVTVTEKLDQSQDVVIVTPIIQVNLSQLGNEVQTVTNTVMSTISSEPTPSVSTVTETLGQSSPSVVTVTSVPPVTVTVGESTQPVGPVTVTVGESSQPAGPVTVTVGESSEPEADQVTSTVVETVKHTETEKVTQTAFATVGISMQNVGESSGWSMSGSSGQQQVGVVNNEPVQQVGHSTFVQTVVTASYDIVRVIGPSYTSTISMHMQQYSDGQAVGLGSDLISPPPVTSSAASAFIQTPYSTSNMLSLPTPTTPSIPSSNGAQGQVVVGGMIVGSSGSSSGGSFQYQGGSSNGSSQNVQSAGTQSAISGQQNAFNGQQNAFGGQQNAFGEQQNVAGGQQNAVGNQQYGPLIS